jgi:hypothetical protein
MWLTLTQLIQVIQQLQYTTHYPDVNRITVKTTPIYYWLVTWNMFASTKIATRLSRALVIS